MKLSLRVIGNNITDIESALRQLLTEKWSSDCFIEIKKGVECDYEFTGSNDVFSNDNNLNVIDPYNP